MSSANALNPEATKTLVNGEMFKVRVRPAVQRQLLTSVTVHEARQQGVVDS